MKTKFMLIITILLFIIAIPLIFNDNTHLIGTFILIISMILSLTRGLIKVWNERRI